MGYWVSFSSCRYQIKTSWSRIKHFTLHSCLLVYFSFFFFFKGIRGTLRGKNNCAQHRSKGTTLDTDKGKQHPRGFAKAQRAGEECSSVRCLGIFSSTQSAHDSNQQNKNCTEHSPQEENKEVTSKFEAWNVREHDNSNSTDFFLILFVHASYDISIFSIQICFFLSKWLMPLSSQGQWRKVSALCDMHQ